MTSVNLMSNSRITKEIYDREDELQFSIGDFVKKYAIIQSIAVWQPPASAVLLVTLKW